MRRARHEHANEHAHENGRRGPAGTTSPLVLVAVALGISVGLAFGIGAYTFAYAKGASYLGSDPAACMNCHIMKEQYDGWSRGSHRAVAGCNDCHAPHDLVGKYVTKAINGFNHSLAFTSGRFHEPIQIGARNRAITEGTCRHCHATLVASISGHAPPASSQGLACTRCHASVGHLH